MEHYVRLQTKLFRVYLYGLGWMTLSRIIFYLRFAPDGILSDYTADIFSSLWMGIRFDTIILCYILAVPMVFHLLMVFIKPNARILLRNFCGVWLAVGIGSLSFMLIADHQYYTYFQDHFNIRFFGFFDDDTTAVVKSMWTDHPVTIIFLIMVVSTTAHIYFVRKFYLRDSSQIMKWKPLAQVLIILGIWVLFVWGIRGKLFSTFPLLLDDATVSAHPFINKATLNGIYTLQKATKEYQTNAKILPPQEVLHTYRYDSIEQAVSVYTKNKDATEKPSHVDSTLWNTTPTNTSIAESPPHVVFVLMESFGSHYLRFHSPKFDLLGRLAPFLNDTTHILYKNFISSTHNTIGSLETLLLGRKNVSGTELQLGSYTSSVAYPYHHAGYETSFIYGGSIGWRYLSDWVPPQHFDHVYGMKKIKEKAPDATSSTWGVHDQYLFEHVYRVLEEADKPQFIFILTTSNHTPYELPPQEEYTHATPSEIKKEIVATEEIAKRSFAAYRYSNDQLGHLLEKVEASHWGENTIIAVTGDHNTHTLFSYDGAETNLLDKSGVPFYIYLPPSYKVDRPIYKHRYGSHKDIFPTLYTLSLSKQRYFDTGNSLLSSNPKAYHYGVYNGVFGFDSTAHTATDVAKYERARSCLIDYYYSKALYDQK